MLIVVGFNLVQLVLLEAPLVAYAVAPEQTPIYIDRGKAWVRRHWRKYAVWALSVIATWLAVRGIIEIV